MSSPYYQRKWAGAPHKELKKTQPAEPSKLGPRKTKSQKKAVVVTDFWHLRPKDKQRYSWRYTSTVYVPCCGRSFTCWDVESAARHTIKRLKANLMLDKKLGIFWIECQATKRQISPEFSQYAGLINWLVFTGIENNWVFVKSYLWRRKNEIQGRYRCTLEEK